MKKRTILPLLILVTSLLVFPVSSTGTNVKHNGVSGVSFTEVNDASAQIYAKASNPNLDLWRNTRDSFNFPGFEYEIVKSEFSTISAEELLQPESSFDSEISVDMVPGGLKNHPAILIDEDKDLRRYPGSGTADDPYVIENYAISHAKKNLIQIENVDSYILIRNNLIDGQNGGNTGIVINNAAHITIENNEIFANNYGIVASNSYDINLIMNSVYNHVYDGVSLSGTSLRVSSNNVTLNGNGIIVSDSDTGVVDFNTVYDNGGRGITLAYSLNFQLISNTVFDNVGDGIFFQDSNQNAVKDNTVYSNGYSSSGTSLMSSALYMGENGLVINAGFTGAGIFLDPSFDNVVEGNTVYDNAAMGVYLEYSDNTTIVNNHIYNNDLTGIFFKDSDDNTIVENDIHHNGDDATISALSTDDMSFVINAGFTGAGIFLDPSFDNTIHNNSIHDNYGTGVSLEYSQSTVISENAISNNGLAGVFFLDSDHNTVTGNTVTDNGQLSSSLSTMATDNPIEMKLMAGFTGAGIFLDPSHYNVISNNIVMNNVGIGVALDKSTNTMVSQNDIISNGNDGVFLLNSSSNTVDRNLITDNGFGIQQLFMQDSNLGNDMEIMAGFTGAGIFLDPSPNNVISNNEISSNAASGIYLLESNRSTIEWNEIVENNAYGIFLQDSSYNNIKSNVINYNAAGLTTYALGLDAGFTGAGIFLDPSHFNVVELNNVTGSYGDGLFLEASSNTQVIENRFLDNTNYGINIDDFSSVSYSTGNNFEGNDGISAQGRDDGISNTFTENFWADHNNNDSDYDGIADEPYELDGDANNVEETPKNIPNGLNFYNATTESNPRKINADSDGTPLTMKVWLDDGFRVLSIDLNKIWLNGTINPHNYHIIDIQTFTVTFNRLEVNQLLKSVSTEHFFAVLELTGLINDELLDITAYDTVEVTFNNSNSLTLLLIGTTGIIPMTVLTRNLGITRRLVSFRKRKFL